MNSVILEKAAAINKRYGEFIEKCDRCEESRQWDVEQYGQMEMYLSNELTCILLRISAADGNISDEEVELFNAICGTSYSLEGLKAVYDEMGDTIRSYSVEGFIKDLAELKEKFTELMVEYAVIVCDSCALLCACDGVVSDEEQQEAKIILTAVGI